MGKTIGAIVTLFVIIGAVYSGGTQMISITDGMYVSKPYFKSFEARQYVMDLRDEIGDAKKEIRIFEYKIDSGTALASWEVRQYEEAKRLKDTYESELNKFLNPTPVNTQSSKP